MAGAGDGGGSRTIRVRSSVLPLSTDERARARERTVAEMEQRGLTAVGAAVREDMDKAIAEGDDSLVVYLPQFSAAISEVVGPLLDDDAMAVLLLCLLEQRLGRL